MKKKFDFDGVSDEIARRVEEQKAARISPELLAAVIADPYGWRLFRQELRGAGSREVSIAEAIRDPGQVIAHRLTTIDPHVAGDAVATLGMKWEHAEILTEYADQYAIRVASSKRADGWGREIVEWSDTEFDRFDGHRIEIAGRVRWLGVREIVEVGRLVGTDRFVARKSWTEKRPGEQHFHTHFSEWVEVERTGVDG